MELISYKKGSKSARVLSRALGILRIKHEGSRFRGAVHKKLINWGCSELNNNLLRCQVINHPDAVRTAANKLLTFQALDGVVNIPEWTTSKEEVEQWYEEKDNQVVFCRRLLNGNSGNGIHISNERAELIDAPLYVKYVPKRNEYRVHVAFGEVIAVQRKALREGVEEPNWKVRNHANGFIFARNEGTVPPDGVVEESLKAVEALGLDFGAVDVIYNERQDKAFVLEVNTAPGLEGETLTDYVNTFRRNV